MQENCKQDFFISTLPHLKEIQNLAFRIAQVEESTILIEGASGTGKEMLARFIHEKSSQAGAPFVEINCASLPEHLLESELFGYEPGAFTDAKKLKKEQLIRLKDLINIQIESIDLNKKSIIASYHSKELDREYSIIQWVPETENIDISILKPDGTISKGKGEISLSEIPMNETIQFERYGFVNAIEIKNNCLYCYFTH